MFARCSRGTEDECEAGFKTVRCGVKGGRYGGMVVVLVLLSPCRSPWFGGGLYLTFRSHVRLRLAFYNKYQAKLL